MKNTTEDIAQIIFSKGPNAHEATEHNYRVNNTKVSHPVTEYSIPCAKVIHSVLRTSLACWRHMDIVFCQEFHLFAGRQLLFSLGGIPNVCVL